MRISDWSSDVCSSDLIDPIAKSPLLSMTPGSMANENVTAASGARGEDARLVAEARAGLDTAARAIGNRLASARRGDKKQRWMCNFGGGCEVLGLLCYCVLAGTVSRIMTTRSDCSAGAE